MRKILVLGCGAGGSSMGYSRAGWDVVGVDIRPQPRYPFPFIRADALTLDQSWNPRAYGFDAVHASPPCQHYSSITKVNGTQHLHPDLVADFRRLLQVSGLPYVIENVVGAPLVDPIRLCGSSLCPSIDEGGRKFTIRRHRLFESNVPLVGVACRHWNEGTVLGVYGGGTRQDTRIRRNLKGGNTQKANRDQARLLMEMPWATRTEMNQAVPPAYTEWIGRQLLRQVDDREVRVSA